MRLQLFAEFAAGAGNENSAGDATLAVFDALHDTRGLAALGTVGALGRVHHFFAVCGFGDFGHVFSFSLAA
jgi:hypothetical protein